MTPRSITADLEIMDRGTEAFLHQVDRLDEESLHGPSLLPGWTRGHVVTHLARNADGMARLATWARSGVETPMYGEAHPRERDIEAGHGRELIAQVADLRDACARLDVAMREVPDPAWSATVRTATRTIQAGYLPWMRAREVWLHTIDLDLGATGDDLPDAFAVRILDEVIHDLARRPGMPALELDAGERVHEVPGEGTPIRIVGSPGALACLLTGRPAAVTVVGGGPPPPIPAWL